MEARGRCRRGSGSKVTANPEDICPATWKRYIMCVYCVYHLPIFLLKSNLRSVFWGDFNTCTCFLWFFLLDSPVFAVGSESPAVVRQGKGSHAYSTSFGSTRGVWDGGMEVWNGDGDGDFLRSCKDTV